MSYSATSTHYTYSIPINLQPGRYMTGTLEFKTPFDPRGDDSTTRSSSRPDRRESRHRHSHSHSASSRRDHPEREHRRRASPSSNGSGSSRKPSKPRKRSATESQISLPKFNFIPPTPPVTTSSATGYITSGSSSTRPASGDKLDRRSTHPRYLQQQPTTSEKQASQTLPYPSTSTAKPRTIADFIHYSRHPFSKSKKNLAPKPDDKMENIDLGYYIPATTEDDLHFHPNAVEIDGKSIDAIPKPISPKKVEFYDEPLPPLNINKNPVSPVIGTPAEHSSPNISPSPPASPYVAYHPNRNSLTPSPSPLSSSPPTSHSTATAERIARHRSSRQVENPYLLLQQFDTVFIIDDSASMFGHNWQEVLEALKTLTRTAFEYTRGYSSGFDLLFLNSWQYNAVQVKTVEEIVSTFKQVVPHGVTPTANVLDGVLRGYLDQFYEMRDRRQAEGLPYSGGRAWEALKPLNVVILTDGEPTDEPEDVIVAIARELDRLNAPLSQVGIQFVQIGDDEHVTEYLEALDDALSKEYQIRDIVDTTPYTGKDLTGDELLKILLGAVNKRLDRQKNQRSGSRREERRDSRHGSTW